MRSKFIAYTLCAAMVFSISFGTISMASGQSAEKVVPSSTDSQKDFVEDGDISSSKVKSVKGLPKYKGDEVIVKYKKNISSTRKSDLKKKLGLVKKESLPLADTEVLKISNKKAVDSVVKSLKYSGIVEIAQPNFIYYAESIPNDQYFGYLWGLNNTGQSIAGITGTVDVDIDAPEAWDKMNSSTQAVVAIIDTGVDFSHPDLAGRAWVNPGEIAGNGKDDDNNGYIDDINGWDFVSNDNTVFHSNENDHGTHVAGTIGAVGNNGIGVAGVAKNVKIMSLKFLDSRGSGATANAIKAVNYAAKMGVKISNNSWGGGGYDDLLKTAIQNSGMLFVAASGNESTNNDATPSYPASYNLSNIISVASIDNNGQLSSFSNYGATSVDVGAPGGYIASTLPGGQYGYESGTSMATPHVTGVAAAVYSQRNGSVTVAELKKAILDTGTPLPSLSGKTVTGKLINLNNAIGQSSTTGNAPTASNAAVSGTVQVGKTLTGSYTFSDVDGDLEGASTYKWLSSDTQTGTFTEIAGAVGKSYALSASDIGKFIKFEVAPVSATGQPSTGAAVSSSAVGPVADSTTPTVDSAPVASNVTISGKVSVGKTLTGKYTFTDADGDLEGASQFRWLRYDAQTAAYVEIAGAASKTYVVTADDKGKNLKFEVTPVSATGSQNIGAAVQSKSVYVRR